MWKVYTHDRWTDGHAVSGSAGNDSRHHAHECGSQRHLCVHRARCYGNGRLNSRVYNDRQVRYYNNDHSDNRVNGIIDGRPDERRQVYTYVHNVRMVSSDDNRLKRAPASGYQRHDICHTIHVHRCHCKRNTY